MTLGFCTWLNPFGTTQSSDRIGGEKHVVYDEYIEEQPAKFGTGVYHASVKFPQSRNVPAI
jgi:hypothetical protein